MQKIYRKEKPVWFDKEKDRKKILEELLKETDYHCSYTDRKIDTFSAEIDRFKPKSLFPELDSQWNNLMVTESHIGRYKSNKYSEKLLNPTDNDYNFDRYFTLDFENCLLLPNFQATDSDKERAIETINILGLNREHIVNDRKMVMEHYLSLYNLIKVNIVQKRKKFKITDYKELKINSYSYRFLLSRALNHFYGEPFEYSTEFEKDTIESVEALDKREVIYKKSEINEYISEIGINRYFGIEDFEVTDLGDKKEIYFLGENGDGKTLILQAILLAIRGLNDKFLYKYVSENLAPDFNIQVKDILGNIYHYNKTNTNINKNVFGFGASRLRHSNQNDIDSNGYLTLFDINSYLINPILWLKEIERKELKGIGNLRLDNAIGLLSSLLENRVQIERTNDGEFVFNERGTRVSFNHLSDGYRSTMIWLCDLVSRLSANQPQISDLKDYKGIVLVDEIGVFLHPRWEYSIVKKLRETFPKIQWIFTTHSPIVILGASKESVIYRLYKENGVTKVTKPYSEPLNMTANSLLTSILWRMDTFTTHGIQQEFVSSDDYVFQKIHQVISTYVQQVPELNDDMVMKMIEEEFEKLRTK